ncbi:hypothetical protein TEA_027240 [Camellia sinensis var. sinensis]|uniref:Uncharacterized protein n=1 Tax=Camellia sinensis var. sinensis TaxID=542762 RepID=A0A4V3WQV7_CAMSN|nr:hypothetical protein TEA_027240 [Camellia sinensis var. sinensis]
MREETEKLCCWTLSELVGVDGGTVDSHWPQTRFVYDPKAVLKAFDESKAGVKGLVDARVVKIPKIFIRPSNDPPDTPNSCLTNLQVPIIDLGGMDCGDRRDEIVDEMCIASEEWWNTFRCVEWIVNLTNKIRRRRKGSTCVIGIEK